MNINNEQMSFAKEQLKHLYYTKEGIIQREDMNIRNKLFDDNKRHIIKLLQTGKAKIKKNVSVKTPLTIMSFFDFPKNFDADYKKQHKQVALTKSKRKKLLEKAYEKALHDVMLAASVVEIKFKLSKFEQIKF